MRDDAAARRRALDPTRSFIVHAPAGSGKTELLIQRYLALLGRVDFPEQILAITFTRKAAREMRHRVLVALEQAETEAADLPQHQLETVRLARTALEADRAKGWQLREQSGRLRIQTVDAFNAWLVSERPLDSGGLGEPDITADPRRYYRLAIRRVLRLVEERQPIARDLRRVLGAWRYDFASLEIALVDLLSKREQWLRHLAPAGGAALRAELEDSWARIIEEAQAKVLALLTDRQTATLEDSCRHAARHAARLSSRHLLEAWLRPSARLAADAKQWAAWNGLLHLLLTAQGTWRKQFGAAMGFGENGAPPSRVLRELVADLAQRHGLLAALARLGRLPRPCYDSAQWRLLAALRSVLLRLAAELTVIFGEHRVADFVEIGLAAQRLLGASEDPSELLLALDRRIEHLLVDEYQDTSHMQYGLLSLLTSGWQIGDGRTLFLVGDAMQSIYRFRDADVKLFMQAEQLRFGETRLERLQLSRNFRSAPAIVAWTNQQFQKVAAVPHEDLVPSTVSMSPCSAERRPEADQFVRVHGLREPGNTAEVELVASLVSLEAKRDPTQSIAILVQNRRHLEDLDTRLRATDHEIATVEIQRLDQTQVGQDLVNLTRALLHLGDRLAWLSSLRAPWCGLTWRDLESISRAAAGRTVWEALGDDAVLHRLSLDGRVRASRIWAHLTAALSRRDEHTLAEWVRDTWHRLGGPECLCEHSDRAAADKFFSLLAAHTDCEDLEDPAMLGELLAQAPLGPEATSARIQIMTLHRAKGLEFDTVILLGLAREPRSEPMPALYWQERVTADGRRRLLLAPPTMRGRTGDPLARHLRDVDEAEAAAERLRLLYVGVTRARERLHLVANVGPCVVHAPPRSLLAPLWPALGPEFGEPREATEAILGADAAGATPLRRLKRLPPPPTVPAQATTVRPPFQWAGATAAHIGTVVHHELRLLAAEPLRQQNQIEERGNRYRRQLALLGVDARDLDSAEMRVKETLLACLADDRGRWLLAPHRQAYSEYVLHLMSPDGQPEQLRIDRTFVDEEGTRWIVDYKTGIHEGGDLDGYLASEVARYRPQLERYGTAMRLLDGVHPIALGLYFPLYRAFRSWPLSS